MEKCPECGKVLKNKAGLSAHLRMVHRQPTSTAKVSTEALKEIGEAVRRLEARLSQQDLRELREAIHRLGLKQEASEKVLRDVLGRLERLQEKKPRGSHISPPSEQAKPAGNPSGSGKADEGGKGFDWGTALLLGGGAYLLWLLLRKRS